MAVPHNQALCVRYDVVLRQRREEQVSAIVVFRPHRHAAAHAVAVHTFALALAVIVARAAHVGLSPIRVVAPPPCVWDVRWAWPVALAELFVPVVALLVQSPVGEEVVALRGAGVGRISVVLFVVFRPIPCPILVLLHVEQRHHTPILCGESKQGLIVTRSKRRGGTTGGEHHDRECGNARLAGSESDRAASAGWRERRSKE